MSEHGRRRRHNGADREAKTAKPVNYNIPDLPRQVRRRLDGVELKPAI